ncbi:MAG: YbaB/EbfC family nucleoid-associated protein [Deltaproteobacteria bacterium]|nr:YbaB/EbfC family nucleoid-associated protein [Deltaproteobacteria bacterium]
MFKGNIGDLMKKAQEMGATLKARQDEMAQREFEASVGGGMVKIVFNGRMEAKSITIDPEVVDPQDIATLQDLVLSAVNMGLRQSRSAISEEMAKITGGMNIPGFPL